MDDTEKAGEISRRDLARLALAVGVAGAACGGTAHAANALSAKGTGNSVLAADITPDALEKIGAKVTRTNSMHLSGSIANYAHDVIKLSARMAATYNAIREDVPETIAMVDLDPLDYLTNRPNQLRFIDTTKVADGAPVHGQLVGTSDVCCPSLCLNAYAARRDAVLSTAEHLFVAGMYHRNELKVELMHRHTSFRAAETVCIGTEGDVRQCLTSERERWLDVGKQLGMTFTWQQVDAADCFMDPRAAGSFAGANADEMVKCELMANDIAIGSTNYLGNFVGERFKIQCGDAPAFTGCAGIGIERFIRAQILANGLDPARWSNLANVVIPPRIEAAKKA